jgi:hypothetical protein
VLQELFGSLMVTGLIVGDGQRDSAAGQRRQFADTLISGQGTG